MFSWGSLLKTANWFYSGQFGDFSWVWNRYRTTFTTWSMGLTEQADIWVMQITDFRSWNCLFISDLVLQNSLKEAWMLPTPTAFYANQLLKTVLRYHSSGNFHGNLKTHNFHFAVRMEFICCFTAAHLNPLWTQGLLCKNTYIIFLFYYLSNTLYSRCK